jgi:crotonobetainyl-CoA:carnitine CoA-transferase CaiB-like acyl-CoA transferase
MAAAFDDCRVLDCSTSVAGAWCSLLLANFGADVTLVEPPEGHPLRRMGPFGPDGVSILARYVLANKRSAVLDLREERARAVLRGLAAQSDIIVESLPPGGKERLGLSWEALEQRRPGSILVSITPHGQTGGRSGRAGNDLSAYALSGWAAVNGLAGREPLKGSGFIASFIAGIAAYGVAATALFVRDRHGIGQQIDVAESETLLEIFGPGLLSGQYRGRPLSRRPVADAIGCFPLPVRDGYVAIQFGQGWRLRDALLVFGLEALAEDERFNTPAAMERHREQFSALIEERMAAWGKLELFEALATLRVNAGPVLTLDELARNEQLRARGYYVHPEDDPHGPEYPGAPFKMSLTPWRFRRSLPHAGAHTAAVLERIGETRGARRFQNPADPYPAPLAPAEQARLKREASSPPAKSGDLHGPEGEGTGSKAADARQASPLPLSDPGARRTGYGSRITDHGSPLKGVRALVLTHAWLGTFCTELLALAGAEVIQVEARRRPDAWRLGYGATMPPALRGLPTARHAWNCSPLYNAVNLNKDAITLDLQTPEGIALFREIVRTSDIVAENFSPRVMQHLGIDYDALRQIRPDLIMCSLSAYGQSGPWRDILGIGGTVEPASGMSSLMGYADGPPFNSGQMLPDPVGGYYGFAAILTALHYRERTGEGQCIDLSMLEANQTLIGDAMLQYMLSGHVRPRLGNRHLSVAPHGIYPAAGADQWIAIAAESEEQWQGLCAIAGHPEWQRDQRFCSNARRKQNEDLLDATIRAWTCTQPRDTLAERLGAVTIAAPVLNGHEVVADPVYRERGVILELTHPEAGTWLQAGVPYHFSRTPDRVTRPAPLLGQDTAAVLERLLGLGPDAYAALVQKGISGSDPPA